MKKPIPPKPHDAPMASPMFPIDVLRKQVPPVDHTKKATGKAKKPPLNFPPAGKK